MHISGNFEPDQNVELCLKMSNLNETNYKNCKTDFADLVIGGDDDTLIDYGADFDTANNTDSENLGIELVG